MPVIVAGFMTAMVLLAGADSVDGEMTTCGGGVVVATVCGPEATGIKFFVSEVICCTGFVAQPAKEIMARTKNRLRRKVSAQ